MVIRARMLKTAKICMFLIQFLYVFFAVVFFIYRWFIEIAYYPYKHMYRH